MRVAHRRRDEGGQRDTARRLDPQVRTSVHYTHLILRDYVQAIARDDEEVSGIRLMALAELGRRDEAIAGMRELEAHLFQGVESHWLAAVRGEELAVALSTTPDSTSANAWPARPFQALPRQIPGSRSLRAVRNVPSDAGVCADHVLP